MKKIESLKWKFAYAIILIALLSLSYGFGTQVGHDSGYKSGYEYGYEEGYHEGEQYVYEMYNSKLSIMNAILDVTANVNVKQWRDGVLILDYTSHNIVVTIGKRYLRNVTGWNNASSPMNATDDISLGQDGSVDASWTKSPTEKTNNGLARASGSVTCLNSTAYQSQYTWSSITGSDTVTSTFLHWNPKSNSDNNLFAGVVITTVTTQSGDQLQITWQVCFP